MLLYFLVIEDRAIEIPMVRTVMTILIPRAYAMKTADPLTMPSRLNEPPTVRKKIGAEQPIETKAYDMPNKNIDGSARFEVPIWILGIFRTGW